MTITTSRGRTFTVNWAWELTGRKRLLIGLSDKRRISEIATDFDGCTRFERKSETEGDMIYDGYTQLVSVVRDMSMAKETVTLTLCKEGA